MQDVFLVLEMIGVVAFAVSGAAAAIDKNTDIFGVMFLGITTALGGGVFRDVMLGYLPPRMFEDVQLSGPFSSWRHRHIVEPHPDGALLRDEIEYEPPMWFLGAIAAPIFIVPKLEKMFDFRHEATRRWCESAD